MNVLRLVCVITIAVVFVGGSFTNQPVLEKPVEAKEPEAKPDPEPSPDIGRLQAQVDRLQGQIVDLNREIVNRDLDHQAELEAYEAEVSGLKATILSAPKPEPPKAPVKSLKTAYRTRTTYRYIWRRAGLFGQRRVRVRIPVRTRVPVRGQSSG